MAAVAETTDRRADALDRFAEAARGVLSLRPTLVVNIVDDLLNLVRSGGLRVRVECQVNPAALVFDFPPQNQLLIEDQRAPHILRMMCANVAVRTGVAIDRPELFFSGSGAIRDVHAPQRPSGWQANWHNTPDGQWLELSWSDVHGLQDSAQGSDL